MFDYSKINQSNGKKNPYIYINFVGKNYSDERIAQKKNRYNKSYEI